MTTYYVSAADGSDNNAGTSAGSPLGTLQAAADLVQPGDTVEVMSGTYTGPAGGDVLDITTSGTESAPITFEAAPGQTPIINSSGAWNGIDVQASNIVINGFTVEGDSASYTLTEAQGEENNTGDPTFDGNGISVQSPGNGVVPNHITIENNTVFNEPGGGIDTVGADYVQILNNIVHNNSNWSPYDNSGISVNASVNSDTNSGVHDIISGNTSYDNADKVPDAFSGSITDGEGIILDTNTDYSGVIEVEDNTAYGNSGPGIEDFLTDNAVITGNTVYGNDTNPALADEGQIFDNQSTGSTITGNTTTNALCFLSGTLIGTASGEVPVERLSVGDEVLTLHGLARRIVWIGTGRVLATRGKRSAATPVIVRKSALTDNVPHHDLRVTKGHAFLIDGVLIPVEELVNHRSILWDDHAQEVSLFHIELETHDILVANGAPAESYRDDGNRWLFRNAHSGWHLPTQEPCAPVLTCGQIVDAAWHRLLERAGPPRGLPLTHDPDLHLLIDGKRIDVLERREAMVAFRLNGRPRSVRICSRAAVPLELGITRDDRLLGVAIRRIVLAQAKQQRAIEADALALADGYHSYEPENGIRWTTGDAAVPMELFAGMNGPAMLMLRLGGMTRYLDEGSAQQVA